MELKELEYLITIAEERSISKLSLIHISEPTRRS